MPPRRPVGLSKFSASERGQQAPPGRRNLPEAGRRGAGVRDYRPSLMTTYEADYKRSLSDPDGYWSDAAAAISWDVPPSERVLDGSNPPFYRWFPGGPLNTCFNAVDRHAESRRADQSALIYDSPVTGS